jgi:hypothetical protein
MAVFFLGAIPALKPRKTIKKGGLLTTAQNWQLIKSENQDDRERRKPYIPVKI